MKKPAAATDAAYLNLYKAVAKYVSVTGGNVVMATGIQIQEWPDARPHEFIVGIKCVGKMPHLINPLQAAKEIVCPSK